MRVKLAEIYCQALLKMPQCVSEAMPGASSEKGDSVRSG
jgi:hypothetical protein